MIGHICTDDMYDDEIDTFNKIGMGVEIKEFIKVLDGINYKFGKSGLL